MPNDWAHCACCFRFTDQFSGDCKVCTRCLERQLDAAPEARPPNYRRIKRWLRQHDQAASKGAGT